MGTEHSKHILKRFRPYLTNISFLPHFPRLWVQNIRRWSYGKEIETLLFKNISSSLEQWFIFEFCAPSELLFPSVLSDLIFFFCSWIKCQKKKNVEWNKIFLDDQRNKSQHAYEWPYGELVMQFYEHCVESIIAQPTSSSSSLFVHAVPVSLYSNKYGHETLNGSSKALSRDTSI